MANGQDTRSVLITGGRLIDGSGSSPFEADILVIEGIIHAILEPSTVTSGWSTRIDAGGATVAPGFIDVHSHADNAPLLADDDLTKIRQGVTTEITGNCGMSLAPVPSHGEDAFRANQRKFFGAVDSSWHSTAEYFAVVDALGYVVNSCPLIGHGSLRSAVIGSVDRPASSEDIRRMGALLTEALAAGAFGMSTGLIYPPGMFSDSAELSAVASYLPPSRVYATHMRNESNDLMRSIEEALVVARDAGCRVQISHLKAGGIANWGAVDIALCALDQARADGLPVTQDAYPYSAASTALAACLPPWVHDGGDEQVIRRLNDDNAKFRMRADIEGRTDLSWDNVISGAGGYHGVLVASTASGRFEGLTVKQIAESAQLDPFDALIHVLLKEKLEATMVDFCMSEDDVERVLAHPSTMIGSDGLPPGRGGRPHPRTFGTFPRVLGHYVRECRTMTLPEAIRRMTSLPAEVFGVPRRGRIAAGMVADLVCFDPERIQHPTDYLNPAQQPIGINWVMQAGHVVIDDSRWQGIRRGARLIPV